jgi:hypothetical protein
VWADARKLAAIRGHVGAGALACPSGAKLRRLLIQIELPKFPLPINYYSGVNLNRPVLLAPTARGTQPLSSYLLPSLADILFISLLLALAYGTPSLRLLNDPGIGWHIRAGEWILQNHAVPHTDLFSNVTSRQWFAWEWLFEVAVAKIHAWWGLNGVLVGGAFVIALTFALLFRLTLRRGASLLAALVFVVLAVLASTIHYLARPHVFTWLFALLCWYLLEEKRATRWLWTIPVIVLVWVNVHGGFLIAFAMLGLSLLGEFWSAVASANQSHDARRNFVQLGQVFGVSLLASLLNPYGWQLYVHIYQYLGDSFLMHHIQEMQSPDFHSFGAKCFAVLLFVAACVAIAKRHLLRPWQILVLAFFSYSALYAVRNIPIACIVLTLTVAPLLTSRDSGFSQRMGAMEMRSRGHAWAILFVLATLVACANGGRLLGQQVIHAGFNADKFPLRAVEFLAQHPPPDSPPGSPLGPLFTTDAWSGYVIYREWPKLRVVVDDRHDMYGSEYMKRYLKIVDGEPDWHAQLQATGARSVLVSSTSALGSLLRLSTDWKLVYDDGQALVFESVPRRN